MLKHLSYAWPDPTARSTVRDMAREGQTFVLQNHIWLAGDSYGLLSLGPYGCGVNVAILMLLFLLVSWHARGATQTLRASIVDGLEMEELELDQGLILNKPKKNVKVHRAQHVKPRNGRAGKCGKCAICCN